MRWGCALALSGPLLAATSLQDQAAAAWVRRAEPGQLEQAIDLWNKALLENPQRTEIYISLTKAAGRGVRHASSSADERRWADQALKLGETAIQRNPQSSEAYTYYAEALGQWAQAHKGLQGLHHVKEAVAALQQALSLNPSNAYAHMLLAQFYLQAPSAISVGDTKAGLTEARKAVALDSAHSIYWVTLADGLKANGQKAEAIEALKKVLSLPAPVDAIPETQSDQANARTRLKSWGVAVPETTVPATSNGSCGAGQTLIPGSSPGACTQSSPMTAGCGESKGDACTQ